MRDPLITDESNTRLNRERQGAQHVHNGDVWLADFITTGDSPPGPVIEMDFVPFRQSQTYRLHKHDHL